MKKYVLLFSIAIVMVSILLFYDNDEKVILTNYNSEQLINSNILTMMYETDVGSGEYQVSSSNVWPQEGYIFNEQLSACENGSTLAWDDENKRVIMSTSVSDKCYVYFDVYEPTLAELCVGKTLAECITTQVYTGVDGENGLYYHDGQGTYINASEEAGDNSYRYAGADPNNYVCFGTDEETCPDDNLYRIIGVFGNEVKLIKNTSIGSYFWDNSSSVWDENTKPDIYTVLNVTYYNELESKWQNLIANHNFEVGGADSGTKTAKQYYNMEIRNQTGYEESMKIGLMYISDYGYAVGSTYWTTYLINYDSVKNENWMFMGNNEWTISRDLNDMTSVFRVNLFGSIVLYYPNDIEFAARPSFYLEYNVTFAGGIGTSIDPYRIN